MKKLNRVGEIINDYIIIKYQKTEKISIKCLICGIQKEMSYSNFTRRVNIHGCLCGKPYLDDFINKIYGDRKIIKFIKKKNNIPIFLTTCLICGFEKEIDLYRLLKKESVSHKSCSITDYKKLNDGTKQFILFRDVWYNLRSRTIDAKNREFKNYGGRGISSEYYKDFKLFYKDQYQKYIYACTIFKNPSIERIDVNGNYELNNITWIDESDQTNNRRNMKWFEGISPEGISYISRNRNTFSKEHNLIKDGIIRCLLYNQKQYKGWTFRYLTEDEISKIK